MNIWLGFVRKYSKVLVVILLILNWVLIKNIYDIPFQRLSLSSLHHNNLKVKDINEFKVKSTEGQHKSMYYPGENIPDLIARKTHELSHEILKRKLSESEYKRFKDLLFDTIQIFNNNGIRYRAPNKVDFVEKFCYYKE